MSIAGTIALAMRESHDPIAQWSGVTLFTIITLTLLVSTMYYAGWGSWIRRRVRHVLRVMALLCCAMAWTPILLAVNLDPLMCCVNVICNLFLIGWVVKNKLPTIDLTGTLWPVWMSFMTLANSACVAMLYTNIDHTALAVPSVLLACGGLMFIFSHKQWLHVVWHIFMLAACIAHYVITWYYLS